MYQECVAETLKSLLTQALVQVPARGARQVAVLDIFKYPCPFWLSGSFFLGLLFGGVSLSAHMLQTSESPLAPGPSTADGRVADRIHVRLPVGTALDQHAERLDVAESGSSVEVLVEVISSVGKRYVMRRPLIVNQYGGRPSAANQAKSTMRSSCRCREICLCRSAGIGV